MHHDKLDQRPYGRGPIQHVVNGPKRGMPRTCGDFAQSMAVKTAVEEDPRNLASGHWPRRNGCRRSRRRRCGLRSLELMAGPARARFGEQHAAERKVLRDVAETLIDVHTHVADAGRRIGSSAEIRPSIWLPC